LSIKCELDSLYLEAYINHRTLSIAVSQDVFLYNVYSLHWLLYLVTLH